MNHHLAGQVFRNIDTRRNFNSFAGCQGLWILSCAFELPDILNQLSVGSANIELFFCNVILSLNPIMIICFRRDHKFPFLNFKFE